MFIPDYRVLDWLIHRVYPQNRICIPKYNFWHENHGEKKYFWNSSMRKSFSSNSFYLLVLKKITNSVTKMIIFPHGGKSEIIFFATCTWPYWHVWANFLSRFQIEGKIDVWISQVVRVKVDGNRFDSRIPVEKLADFT